MNIEKIQTQKISEAVEEQIEKMIVSGAFQSGEKLPSVRELCDMFGVGRSAVRDAITTLKGKGIVDVRRGEGAFVCQFDCTKLFASSVLLPSFDDIQELFQVRKILEAGIAEMAALHRTEHDLKVMKKILSDESAERWEADYEFHLALAKAAKNDILIQFIQFISEMMKKTMVDFHIYVEKNNSTIKIIAEQHEEIYEKIKNRDCKRANEAMIYHLNYVEKLLQR
ncbi:FadR/GntR family transcriptional regulator [Metabacillus fastidiosus]|uniref:FadR/GntR family transcriptional regulator n=1 Tax=Metabacillus fastidiosus TaxID=1458 RepID=UPI003D27C62B